MKFIEVDCPVCGQNDCNTVFPDTLGEAPPVFGYKWTPETRKCYRIVRCRRCSHMYASPRLEDMYAQYTDVSDEGYLDNAPLRAATARKVLVTISKLLPGGKLLDIGCSCGDFLKEAGKYYDVEGLELSKWAADIAEKSGLTIHRKKIEEMADRGSKYDVITMWGVIEHLEYPSKELIHIGEILNTGGLVCFWTGDSNSITAKILGRYWGYLIGQHIQFFSRRSIDLLMGKCGLELVSMHTYPYVISLKYLGTHMAHYPVFGAILSWILNLKLLCNLTITLKIPGEMFGIYRKR
jgi:SAM-dependent methyltransferase